MWRRSFVATAVAIGGTVDDALLASGSPGSAAESAAVDALVDGLRAPLRSKRAAALALAVSEIVLAVDELSLSKAPASAGAS